MIRSSLSNHVKCSADLQKYKAEVLSIDIVDEALFNYKLQVALFSLRYCVHAKSSISIDHMIHLISKLLSRPIKKKEEKKVVYAKCIYILIQCK